MIFGLTLLAGTAAAQPLVAPTQETVGLARGEDAGGYNFLNSFELGWRFRDVNGDLGKYRSDVNFGNGLRLLSSSLRIQSREGRGRFFDQLSLQTQGLGNDPYQFSSLRLEKNRLYRYDLTWRLQDYFNPALPLAFGLHAMDTQRRMQDHDLTLLPESAVRLFVGYSRNLQDGPALTTFRDPTTAVVPLFADVRRLQNEYRLGGEARLFGARFTVLRGWANFSENTRQSGDNPRSGTERAEPYRGSNPYWRLSLHKEAERWAAVARWSYAGARRRFFFDELVDFSDPGGAARSRQTLVAGTGRRPVSTGSLALSFFPTRDLTVTNTTSFYNTRMDGDSSFRQVTNALTFETLDFQFLGIRTIANSTEASLRVRPWVTLYGGHQFSTRRIRSVQREAGDAATASEYDNTQNSGLAGVRLQPLKPLSIHFDAELGRSDRPVFPVSERNYHLLGARMQYRTRTLTLTASARAFYNHSPVSLAEHSSRSRSYSADASWAPGGWFSLDGGYSRIHLDTLTGIAYFSLGELVRDRSLFLSNLHTGYLAARFAIRGRADLTLGYTRVEDSADSAIAAPGLGPLEAAQPYFSNARAFPMHYETPLARVSLRIREKLRFNVGWQFYRYGEERAPVVGTPARQYNAHTGYTSLLWSF